MKILIQTTIPFAADHWNAGRFTFLRMNSALLDTT